MASALSRATASGVNGARRIAAARGVAAAPRHWGRSGSGAPRRAAAATAAPFTAAVAAPRRAPRCASQVGAAVTETAADAPAPAKLPPLPPLDADYEAGTAFADFANWLLPGALMLGRYPYVEPSRCSTPDQGAAQLEVILSAGPHVFVSLQDEVPDQGAMRIGGVAGFLPYKATAELIAASQTPPPPTAVVNGLRNPTLDKFLPKRKRAVEPEVAAYYEAERVAFVRWPIVDLGVPSMQQLVDMVEDVAARLSRGDRVYLHCWGGRGRAGTVGACLLARLYGLSADEALERVQRAFDTRRDEGRRSPETEEQRRLVRAYAAQLGQQSGP